MHHKGGSGEKNADKMTTQGAERNNEREGVIKTL
jgi:hypothetical protein